MPHRMTINGVFDNFQLSRDKYHIMIIAENSLEMTLFEVKTVNFKNPKTLKLIDIIKKIR